MPRFFGVLNFERGIRLMGIGLLAALCGVTSHSAFAKTNIKPLWTEDYRVLSGASCAQTPNASFLHDIQPVIQPRGQLTTEIDQIYDRERILARSQQYVSMNRDYEMRQRAGLLDIHEERSHIGAMSGLGNQVWDEIQQRKLEQVGNKAKRLFEGNEVIMGVASPMIVAYGVYIGLPIKLRVADETRFSLSTNIRGKTGYLQFHSPHFFGSFEYRPLAPESRNPNSPSGVDFGQAMNFGYSADFSQERYQLTLSRPLPFFGLSTSILYGSSSNAVVGSLSKKLTDNLSCVVDSVQGLSAFNNVRTDEEKVRLRYDISF